MNVEALAMMVWAATKGMAITEAKDLGAKVGDALNDKIEGTATEWDDEGKEVLKAFLDGLRPELDVEGVDP